MAKRRELLKSAFKNIKKPKFVNTSHCINDNHVFDFGNTTIDVEYNWRKRTLEMIFINHNPNSINIEENIDN